MSDNDLGKHRLSKRVLTAFEKFYVPLVASPRYAPPSGRSSRFKAFNEIKSKIALVFLSAALLSSAGGFSIQASESNSLGGGDSRVPASQEVVSAQESLSTSLDVTPVASQVAPAPPKNVSSGEGAGAGFKFAGVELNVTNVNERFIWILVLLFIGGFLFYALKPRKSYNAVRRAVWVIPVVAVTIISLGLLAGYILGLTAFQDKQMKAARPDIPQGREARENPAHAEVKPQVLQAELGQHASPRLEIEGATEEASRPPVIPRVAPRSIYVENSFPSNSNPSMPSFHWYVVSGCFLLVIGFLYSLYKLLGRLISRGPEEGLDKDETRERAQILLRGLIGLVWAFSCLVFAVACQVIVVKSDIGNVVTVLFGASSIALFIFSLFVALLAIMGWQSIKDYIGKSVTDAVGSATQSLENELRGRVSTVLGYAIGEMSLNPDFDAGDKDRLEEAVSQCRVGYRYLQKVPGAPEFLSLNNLIFYSCVLHGEQPSKADEVYMLREARRLRDAGEEHDVPMMKLTAARVFLEYGAAPEEKAQARATLRILAEPTSRSSEREKKEALRYLKKYAEPLKETSHEGPVHLVPK